MREPEVGVLRCGGRPARADAQVLVEPVRSDNLARVHPVLRVEDRLELAERPGELGAEHLGQQLAAALPVAVLAGERPAQLDD